jgi:diacylglycerol kinase (ATP)
MKVLFVVNPRSGVQPDISLDELIRKQAALTGFDFHIYKMGNDNERCINELIHEYQPDCVAAVGGDGTVNLVAGLLANTDTPLLIVPNGSANGMAKELEIYKVEQAIALLGTGKQKRIDLIKINGQISVHLADVGLNARIVKRFEADSRRGIMTYARHLFGEIFLMKHYKFYIIADGTPFNRRAVSVTFANASKYGTGAVINPHGKLSDGLFELIIVKPFPNIKLLSIAWKMFFNQLHTSDYVEVLSCKEAFLRCSRRTTLQIDGEVIGRVKEFKVIMMHNALSVLVPKVT